MSSCWPAVTDHAFFIPVLPSLLTALRPLKCAPRRRWVTISTTGPGLQRYWLLLVVNYLAARPAGPLRLKLEAADWWEHCCHHSRLLSLASSLIALVLGMIEISALRPSQYNFNNFQLSQCRALPGADPFFQKLSSNLRPIPCLPLSLPMSQCSGPSP
jgi:hypothetical protein